MLAIALITYVVPLEEVLVHVADHRAYLKTLHDAGRLVASGPFEPRTGGALLLRVKEASELTGIVAADPFYLRKIATYEVKVWAPTFGKELLDP